MDQPEHQMPDINLNSMSLAELRDLQKALVKAIANFEVRQKTDARNKLVILAHELGYNFDELAELGGPKIKRAPSTTIYRHPENSTITWSGRGRKPAWYIAHIEAGGDPEALLG
jgi:DNA-binding protein H-NS